MRFRRKPNCLEQSANMGCLIMFVSMVFLLMGEVEDFLGYFFLGILFFLPIKILDLIKNDQKFTDTTTYTNQRKRKKAKLSVPKLKAKKTYRAFLIFTPLFVLITGLILGNTALGGIYMATSFVLMLFLYVKNKKHWTPPRFWITLA